MKFYRLNNVGGADMSFKDRLARSRKLRDEVFKKYHRMEDKKMDENKSDDLTRGAEHFYEIQISYLNGDAP